MTIGLQRGMNKIVPHSPMWEKLYEEERKTLQESIGSHIRDIQHIGSTAVPDMPAKPIIDIAVGVKKLNVAEKMRKEMEGLGYAYFGKHGISGQRLFVKGSEAARTHYVHVVTYDGWKWNEYVALRDYLRSSPETAKEYAQLKLELAKKFPHDRKAYTAEKTQFIQQILRRVYTNKHEH